MIEDKELLKQIRDFIDNESPKLRLGVLKFLEPLKKRKASKKEPHEKIIQKTFQEALECFDDAVIRMEEICVETSTARDHFLYSRIEAMSSAIWSLHVSINTYRKEAAVVCSLHIGLSPIRNNIRNYIGKVFPDSNQQVARIKELKYIDEQIEIGRAELEKNKNTVSEWYKNIEDIKKQQEIEKVKLTDMEKSRNIEHLMDDVARYYIAEKSPDSVEARSLNRLFSLLLQLRNDSSNAESSRWLQGLLLIRDQLVRDRALEGEFGSCMAETFMKEAGRFILERIEKESKRTEWEYYNPFFSRCRSFDGTSMINNARRWIDEK